MKFFFIYITFDHFFIVGRISLGNVNSPTTHLLCHIFQQLYNPYILFADGCDILQDASHFFRSICTDGLLNHS